MCPSVDVQVAHIGKHFFDQSPFLTNSSVVLLACRVHGLHTNSNILWRSTFLKATIGRLYCARIHVLSRVYIFRLTLIALIIYRLCDSYGCMCSFTLIRFVSGINSGCVMHDTASCIAAQTAPAVVKIDIDF